MDKKQMLGFGLILVLLAWWLYMNQPTEAERLEIARKEDSLARVENQQVPATTQSEDKNVDTAISDTLSEDDSVSTEKLTARFGVFAPSASGEEEITTICLLYTSDAADDLLCVDL